LPSAHLGGGPIIVLIWIFLVVGGWWCMKIRVLRLPRRNDRCRVVGWTRLAGALTILPSLVFRVRNSLQEVISV
jgi:hypothetical protein